MTQSHQITVAVVGLGYFSQFHLRSWSRIEGVRLVAAADPDPSRRTEAKQNYSIELFDSLADLLDAHDPDILDVVAPPSAHAKLIQQGLSRARTIICQKPFCTSLSEAENMCRLAENSNCRLVIHENFRFQPWYRDLKLFLDDGKLGEIYQARFALRPGDGRGQSAYLDRQPAFQKMDRFLIHETGVHFIDVFRWLLGPIQAVYADTRRLNSAIAGEDAGMLILTHENGARSIFDGNRLVDHQAENLRRTMGELEIEGERGTVLLNGDGRLSFRKFGDLQFEPLPASTELDSDSFGGGCVEALNRHVVEAMTVGKPLENAARDYLSVIKVDDAAYRSVQSGARQTV